MGKCFAVMDTSGEELCLLAVTASKCGKYSLEGYHRLSSASLLGEFRTGSIHSREAVAGALSDLSKKCGMNFHDVYTGISSSSVELTRSSGSVLISRYGREISCRDIKRCVNIGAMARIPLEREVVHTIVKGFSVDGERPIKDPEGMEAVKLGVEVNILTVKMSVLSNLSKTIAFAGYAPAGFVFSPLSFANRILNEEERIDRTVFVFFRCKKTEVLIFSSGALDDCRVFDRGIFYEDKFSPAGDKNADEQQWFLDAVSSMPGWQGIKNIVISATEPVTDDFLQKIEHEFNLPVRVGSPSTYPSGNLFYEPSVYAPAMGVLEHIMAEKIKKHADRNPLKNVFTKAVCMLDEYF